MVSLMPSSAHPSASLAEHEHRIALNHSHKLFTLPTGAHSPSFPPSCSRRLLAGRAGRVPGILEEPKPEWEHAVLSDLAEIKARLSAIEKRIPDG